MVKISGIDLRQAGRKKLHICPRRKILTCLAGLWIARRNVDADLYLTSMSNLSSIGWRSFCNLSTIKKVTILATERSTPWLITLSNDKVMTNFPLAEDSLKCAVISCPTVSLYMVDSEWIKVTRPVGLLLLIPTWPWSWSLNIFWTSRSTRLFSFDGLCQRYYSKWFRAGLDDRLMTYLHIHIFIFVILSKCPC